jgi:Predicted hydrolase (metallo-beta-lactamase superfamily)
MMKALAFFFLITLSATVLSDLPAGRFFVVWNVGQGLWTTEIDKDCQHFDMGGEFFPLKKISKWCAGRKNKIYLSHWDLDHVGGLKRKKTLGGDVCLALKPVGKTSRRKENLLLGLPSCESDLDLKILKGSALSKNSNDRSHTIVNKKFLLPGDASITTEKTVMIPRLNLSGVEVLILGHHGSKTSTSEDLLKDMPSLRMAMASARWARYHHPHPLVAAKLKLRGVSLLKTEDWGNIWFELEGK